MRKLLLTSIVLALGLGGAFLALSPGAHARILNGTLNGSVGSVANHDAFQIALSASWVTPGTYTINITDYSTIHNFDLCAGTSCTGSNSVDATTIPGTGSVSWSVNLAAGTYTYQCDAHSNVLHGTLVVSTTPPLAGTITKVTSTRKVVTMTAKANQPAHFTAFLLKSGKKLATTTAPGTPTTATLKLKPAKALKPGLYVAQVRVFTSPTNFKVIKKKIKVM
jgi:plastocyanin